MQILCKLLLSARPSGLYDGEGLNDGEHDTALNVVYELLP